MKRMILLLSVLVPTILLANVNELKTLSVSTGDNYVEIELTFTSTPSNVHDFMLSNPARIVIDAEGIQYALSSNIFPVNQGLLLRIRGSQFKIEPRVARVVIDLKKPVKYEVIRSENKIRVKVFTQPTKIGYKKTVKGGSNKGTNITSQDKSNGIKEYRKEVEGSGKSAISVGAKFFYSARGRKDPFKPISETSVKQDTLLDIAKAKLIGVIQDSTGYVALIEDKNGNGFILRRGDRIKRGRVVRVTKNMAVFAISDFGFTRTVILKIEKEEVSK